MGLFDHVEMNQNQRDRAGVVREKFEACEAAIREHVLSSPEQTLCLRRLQEASMWANRAIAHEGEPSPH